MKLCHKILIVCVRVYVIIFIIFIIITNMVTSLLVDNEWERGSANICSRWISVYLKSWSWDSVSTAFLNKQQRYTHSESQFFFSKFGVLHHLIHIFRHGHFLKGPFLWMSENSTTLILVIWWPCPYISSHSAR